MNCELIVRQKLFLAILLDSEITCWSAVDELYQRPLEATSYTGFYLRLPPRALVRGCYVADKKRQIQNKLVPVLHWFVIDWNRFKQHSKRAKTVIQKSDKKKSDKKKAIKRSAYIKARIRGWHKRSMRNNVKLARLMTCFPKKQKKIWICRIKKCKY